MSRHRLVDAVVIGAGPAGSSAALTLARAGHEVVLVDRARFPRDKCCGDGLTTGALRRLEGLGLDPGLLTSFVPVDALVVRSPSGNTAELGLRSPTGIRGAVVRRSELDAALVGLAERAGAELSHGRPVTSLAAPASAKDAVTVGFDDGATLEAPFVVAADGAWSPTRRLLAATPPASAHRGDWHAFRLYVEGVSNPAAQRLWVWFEASTLPGYAWSFPLSDGSANVGLCLRRAPGTRGGELRASFEALLRAPFATSLLGRHARASSPIRSWPIPSGTDHSLLSAASGRVLFAGDAARGADPLTGEGIAQALEMGAAAAEAVSQALKRASPGLAEAAYRRALAPLLADHRLSFRLADVVSHRLGAEAAVALSGRNSWTRRAGGLMLFDDGPRTKVARVSGWPTLLGEVVRRRLGHGGDDAPYASRFPSGCWPAG